MTNFSLGWKSLHVIANGFLRRFVQEAEVKSSANRAEILVRAEIRRVIAPKTDQSKCENWGRQSCRVQCWLSYNWHLCPSQSLHFDWPAATRSHQKVVKKKKLSKTLSSGHGTCLTAKVSVFWRYPYYRGSLYGILFFFNWFKNIYFPAEM